MTLSKWRVFYRIRIDGGIKFIIVEAIDRWEASKKAYRQLYNSKAVIVDVKEEK